MAPPWIIFSVTDRCQLDCLHCFRDPGRPPRDLPLPVAERVLAQAREHYGAGHVGLTGGEPTLYPGLEPLLAAIDAQGFTWHLVTNGQRLQQRLLRLLDRRPGWARALTAVDLSLDGADAEVHDRLRGAGSFRAAVQAATGCHARRLPFTLQMTVNALNVHQLEAVALLASDLGAQRVSYCLTQPTGTSRDALLALPPAAWAEVVGRLGRLRKALTLPITCPESVRTPHRFFTCEPFASQLLNVDEGGHLVLCCQLASGAGAGGQAVVADLARVPLVQAHRQLLQRAHRLQLQRLQELDAPAPDLGPDPDPDPWDGYPCNRCQRLHGLPYWTGGDGAPVRAAGPRAARVRWRGAWAEGRR